MKSIFTTPKLCKSTAGWYVHFRYNGKQKRYKMGLNYIKNFKERESEGNALAKVLHQKLLSGWNPLINENVAQKETLLMSALDFALQKKRLSISKKTYSGYLSTVRFIKSTIKFLCLDYLYVNEVKRSHIKMIFAKAKELNSWSNKSYNKNMNYLSAVMDELIEWDIIENNPVTKIKRLPTEESVANRPPTEKEHQIIKAELQVKDPNFCNFLKVEYHTGIRPKEILSIKLGMIDLETREINLPPKITKSGTIKRCVVINDHLKNLLVEMEIDHLPNDFYLFGSFRPQGQGNRGSFLDFIPAPTPIKRDTATKRWKRIVKDGLGIDVNMYAYKHKGGDDKIRAGIQLDSIRNQYGHKTKKMTEHYVKEVRGVYKQDIIDNSPKF